jgi:choice-of-anchor B domain-containing protein
MNQEYLVMDDEFDEVNRAGAADDGNPVSYIWDIKDLESPKNTGYYKSSAHSIDHNQYIHDGKSFQSNYGSGLRILDVSSIPEDPTGGSIKEIGFFDVYPEDDVEPEGGLTQFVGSWSSYAYFKSGFMFVNTIERGGFVLKYREP